MNIWGVLSSVQFYAGPESFTPGRLERTLQTDHDTVGSYTTLSEISEWCERSLDHVAFADISISANLVTQAKRTRRTTFWDSLSSLGKKEWKHLARFQFWRSVFIRWDYWALHWNEYIDTVWNSDLYHEDSERIVLNGKFLDKCEDVTLPVTIINFISCLCLLKYICTIVFNFISCLQIFE